MYLPYSSTQELLKPIASSKRCSRSGVQRLLVSRSQIGWAGDAGPYQKSKKMLSETRNSTTVPARSRFTM
jgi:hypothetical protein